MGNGCSFSPKHRLSIDHHNYCHADLRPLEGLVLQGDGYFRNGTTFINIFSSNAINRGSANLLSRLESE